MSVSSARESIRSVGDVSGNGEGEGNEGGKTAVGAGESEKELSSIPKPESRGDRASVSDMSLESD